MIVTILLAASYALSQGVNLWHARATNPALPYSYIISTDGTKYWATNGMTGLIDFQSTNFSSVFQSVISSLPAFNYPFGGGSVFLTYGVYHTNNTLTVDRPLNLVGENRYDMACIKADSGLTGRLFDAENTYHLMISNLYFEGNNIGGDYTLYIDDGYPVLENVYVMRSNGTGIYISAQDTHCYDVCSEFCANIAMMSTLNFVLIMVGKSTPTKTFNCTAARLGTTAIQAC